MGSSLVSAYSVGSPTTLNPTDPVPSQVGWCGGEAGSLYLNEIAKWRSGEESGLLQLQWRLASNHFEWQEFVEQELRPRHQNRPTVIFLLKSRTKKRFSMKSAAPLVGTPKRGPKCVDST